MRNFLFIIILFPILLLSKSFEQNEIDKNKILEDLTRKLELNRIKLEKETAVRWRKKRSYIKQMKLDKEEYESIKEELENLYSKLNRIKEDSYSLDNVSETERGNLNSKKEKISYISSSIKELFTKESNDLILKFPLDLEIRQLDLEILRRNFSKKNNIVRGINDYIGFRNKFLTKGSKLSICKQTIIPKGSGPIDANIARFGSVFAYAVDENADKLFYFHQSGKLGGNKFLLDSIGNTEFADIIKNTFSDWLRKQKISGIVPVDVLQNKHSNLLISDNKNNFINRIFEYIKSGGPVMIPLLILPFWALVLIIVKLNQLVKIKKSINLYIKKVMPLISNGNYEKVLAVKADKWNIMHGIVTSCLKNTNKDREFAEKIVEDEIELKLPFLGTHLSTLSVIAGVAPLLGLLGTVTGMISLFRVITHYGTGDPKIMAGGISEALLTTQTGLIIAVPILLIHNYLKNKRTAILAMIEKHSIEILNNVWPR